MATTLYLRTLTPPAPFASELLMSLSRGSAAGLVSSISTIASGNHREMPKRGVFRVNAVTISGTISLNWWGYESDMSANAGFAVAIDRYDGSGAFVSTVVEQANANHADGVELAVGSPGAARSWTATPTSTTFADGDWIRVIFHADAVGTMGGSYTVSLDGDGPTEAASGDSYVTFTETITEYVAAAGRGIGPRAVLQAVHRASSY
jgi:hypothetical protein